MQTVVLTGGNSKRMGTDKAMLPFRGKTLLQYQIDKFSNLGDVAVSVNYPSRFPHLNAREVVDQFPGCGPLNGIVSGFSVFSEDSIFITAVDLPFASIDLALKLYQMKGNYDACLIQKESDKIEPAFAVYSRRCEEIARKCIELQKYSFFDLFKLCNVRYVFPSELNGFNLEYLLKNINTPDDYRTIE